MTLLYSINGRATTYDRVPAVSPVTPTLSTFSSLLSEQMSAEIADGAGAPVLPARRHGLRDYDAKQAEERRKRILIAQDLMTKDPRCIDRTVSMQRADEIMRQQQFRHLPVVTPEGHLCGMLSDRDLLKAGGKAALEPVSLHMSALVLTATPDTAIQQIAEAMLYNRVHSMPIVDSGHRIIGILTSTDILRAVMHNAPLELWA